MKKIAFIVDSSSGIRNGQFLNVFVIPLQITEIINSKVINYQDQVDISDQMIVEKLKNGANLKTSTPNVGSFLELVERLKIEYDQIVALPIPKTLSSSFHAWKLAVEDEPNVLVIDHPFVSEMVLPLIQKIAKRNEQYDLEIEDINEIVDEYSSKNFALLIVPSPKWLARGGRVSNAKAVLINLLNLKIIISVDKDGLKFYDKARNDDGILKIINNAFKKRLGELNNNIANAIILGSSDGSYDYQPLVNGVCQMYNIQNHHLIKLPATIVCHTGPNYFAICLTKK